VARAPASTGKRYMVALGKSEETQAIEDVLAESKAPDLCSTLLDATKLVDAMAEAGSGVVPLTRTLNKALTELGFTFLGRFRAGGEKVRYWSRRPALFSRDGTAIVALIRDYLGEDL
jgi:hypothetical protein